MKDISEELVRHGWNYLRARTASPAVTGESCQASSTQGPVYYQKLKHGADKMSGASPPRAVLPPGSP